MFGRGKCLLIRIRQQVKWGASRLFVHPAIPIRIHNNPKFVIDLHFEKYYTHHIEVTPTCDYFMEVPRFVDQIHAEISACIFLYSLKKGD